MSQQRSEFDPELEVPVLHESASAPALSGDRIDRLLADPAAETQTDEVIEAAPMAGIWLGVTIGLALWAVISAVVLFVRPG